MKRRVTVIILLILFYSLASGQDYYVNSSSGSNSTGNGSMSNPWKTITYALYQMTGIGNHTIYVSAGTYDIYSGEEFPLLMVDGVSLVGAGKDVTIIDADYTNYVIHCMYIFDPEVRIEGFTITGGGSYGPGGIAVTSGSLILITNNNITSNYAGGNASGAAIHVENSSPRIEMNNITDNHGVDINQGACIYVTGTSSAPVISNNIITGNRNDIDAGGGTVGAGTIAVVGSSGTVIHNNIITDNHPGYYLEGGALYINNCSPSVKYNLIAKNSGNGIGILFSSSSPTIINNTISDNEFDGIYLYASTPDSIINNIISYNGGYGIVEYSSGYDPVRVWYNLFYQNVTAVYYDEGTSIITAVNILNVSVPECENNLSGSPLFVDKTNNNYHISLNSSAINTGFPASPLDPDGSIADIGAYYYEPPPEAPIALSATSVTYSGFRANWHSVAGATGYYLDVATDVDFTLFVSDLNNKNIDADTTFLVTGLSPNTVYYYRVRAFNETGQSVSSNVINPATLQIPPPDPPVATEPTGITQTSFFANWEESAIATGYYLDVAADIDFTNYIVGFDNKDVGANTTNEITSLNPNTTYYYRVWAYNTGGNSTFSNVVDLITLQVLPPAAPNAISPGNITQTEFDANWESSSTATGYYLDVATDAGFTGLLVDYSEKDVGNVNTFRVTGLSINTQYYYRVRAYNDGGSSSSSIVIPVTTLLNPPDPPVAPTSNEATDLSQSGFTANWLSAESATGYQLDLAYDASFEDYVSGYDNLDVFNDTIYHVSGLTSNSYYYYRVRAYNSGGISANSETITVITLPDPPLAPVNLSTSGLSQTGFTINWNSSANADGYYLDIATDIDFTNFLDGFENLDVLNLLSYPVTGLDINTTYHYRLRAYNEGGTSESSGIVTVTTLLNPPDPPDPPLAYEESNIQLTGFTANWQSVETATGYLIDVAEDNMFTSVLSAYNGKDVGNTTNTDVTGLESNTTYYYRIRAYNEGGTGNSSNIITVTTLRAPPPPPTGLTATSCNNLVTLAWNQSSESDFLRYQIYGGTTTHSTNLIASTTNQISATTMVISDLTNDQNYYFRVTTLLTTGSESDYSSEISIKVKTGYIPRIKSKWNDILICYNKADSITDFQWYMGDSPIDGATNQYYVTNFQPGGYHVLITDINGCQNISNIVDLSGSGSLSVYPNPAVNTFTLKMTSEAIGNAVIRLYNSFGVRIMEYTTEKHGIELNYEIPVSGMKNGIYTMEVTVNEEYYGYSRIVIIK